MKQLLLIIARNLVENPDAVEVTEEQRDNTILLKLKVAPEEMGKVIGKHGRIAKAIRSVVKAAAIQNNKRVTIEIEQ